MKGSLFVNGLTIDWNKVDPDSYLHRITALSGMESLSFEAPVTFFVGENGTGKSTLLEAIAAAYGLNPEGGSICAFPPENPIPLCMKGWF